MKPLISIIIPTYNRANLIVDALDSLINQSYKNWECIVVDDGSTDNTADVMTEYIEKDSRIKYCHRPLNKTKGPNACRNFGFELSIGDYIKWFDSDDIFVDNSLEITSKYFNDKYDAIVSSLEYVTFELNKVDKEHNFLSDNTIEDYLVGKTSYFTFTPTWKKSFLTKQIELFDEEITNLDDWDFNLRMLYQKPSIVYLDEPLIKYRVHSSSLSHEIAKFNLKEIQSEFKAREKHLKLIKENKLADPRILDCYIKDRYKILLRSSLIHNDTSKFYLLQKLLYKQIVTFDVKSLVITFFASIIFLISGKGYKLLK